MIHSNSWNSHPAYTSPGMRFPVPEYHSFKRQKMKDPLYPGVHIGEIPGGIHTITGASTSVTAFIGCTAQGPVNTAVRVQSWTDFERQFGRPDDYRHVSHAVRLFFLNGGTDALIVRVTGKEDERNPGASDIIGNYDQKTGIYALRDTDIFNIMAIPQTATLGDDEAREVIGRAIVFCEEKRAFFLVDYNPSCDAASIGKWVSQLGPQKNAAVYFPRLVVRDPYDNNRPKELPASGAIAGIYARTDSGRGVWKAPAGSGAVLQGVDKLSIKVTDKENDTLTQQDINCLRYLPGQGNVCWGARTLEGGNTPGSEWKYVPVRRLALYIEESVDRGTEWVVYEPSEESTWNSIRLSIEPFLMSLFRAGAFAGTTPRQAFFVKCDKETMTRTDINNGVVNIVPGFAPARPAEFITLSVRKQAVVLKKKRYRC